MIGPNKLLEVLTPKGVACGIVGGLAVFGSMHVADRIEDVYDFLTPSMPNIDLDLPEALQNPPATIDIDTTKAIFTEISSQLVHQKTDSVENAILNYDNKDLGFLPSSIAGAKLEDAPLYGNVTAMVDFSKVNESDIRRTYDERGLIIKLPKAEHFVTKIDEDRTNLELDQGWFNDAFGARESGDHVRGLAEQIITDTALQNNLLENTQDAAGHSIRSLVTAILASQNIEVDPADIRIVFADSERPDDVREQDEQVMESADRR